jgi:ferrous iron transport protein B
MACHEVPSSTKIKVKQRSVIVGIIGNPNVGKSALFNKLTKGKAWVGNWPGVTVEKKIGKVNLGEASVEIVDLPGIYGLTAHSQDEIIARKFLVEEKPEIVIQVANAVNLERNLYLTIQLLEMNLKLIIALNMVDLAEREGVEIDIHGLINELKIPIIPVVAIKGVGINQLIETMIEQIDKPTVSFKLDYGEEIEEAIEKISKIIDSSMRKLDLRVDSRWLAIRLLEDDNDVVEQLKSRGLESVIRESKRIKDELEARFNKSVEVLMIEKRYHYILSLSKKYIKRKQARESLTIFTNKLDKVLTHPIIGLMIFVSMLYLLFKLSFDIVTPLTGLIETFFSHYVYNLFKTSLLPEIISSLLADAVLNGVGIVLIFIPNLLFLFLGISFLEDTGYLARVAFLFDKWMSKLGLSGRAVIPLLIGFGCNVPAIMSTRVLGTDRDRRLTVFMIPFMSCSARLPIYLLFTLAFFKENQIIVILSIYFIGVVTAIITAILFNNLLFKGQTVGYVMDMPPYLVPSAISVLIKSWERVKSFLIRAGTIIVSLMVVIWVLSITGPEGYLGAEALSNPELLSRSWIVLFSKLLEPLFKPFNWDWRITASLMFGFIAKEVVVSSLAVLYGAGEQGLPSVLLSSFTPLTAYSLMAFTLLYTPCMATVATIKTEIGLKYTLLIVSYQLIIAYTITCVILLIGGLIT